LGSRFSALGERGEKKGVGKKDRILQSFQPKVRYWKDMLRYGSRVINSEEERGRLLVIEL